MALTDNLISYWKLDESSGNAADSSGNAYTLTNQGTMTYAAAKINNGAVISPTGSKFLKRTDALGMDANGNRSFSFWFNATSLTGTTDLFGLNIPSTSPYLQWVVSVSSTAMQVNRGKMCVANEYMTYTAGTSTGTWYHVVVTWDGTTLTLYRNGTSVATATPTGSGSTACGSDTFDIGANPSAETTLFDGLIDEVGIWSRALSASEVTSLYNGGAGFQYPFVQDLSINVNDTLSITESVTQTLISDISVTDTLAITESVTVLIPTLVPSVSDNLAITESVTLINLNISLSDTLAITESVTISNSQLGDISVIDTLSITESVTLTLVSDINVNDQLTITESISQILLLNISTSDILTIAEDVTRILISYINIVETSLVIEDVVINNSNLGEINTNETLAITESLTTTNATLAGINLTEALSIAESSTITNATLSGINLTETLSITENVTATETEEGGNPNVYDTLTITESQTISLNPADLDISETLTLSEYVPTPEVPINSSNTDTLTISESITLENFRFSPSRTVPVGTVRVFSPYGR